MRTTLKRVSVWGRIRNHLLPHWLVALGYLVTILVGTFLLSLPSANTGGEWQPWLPSLFTATSATCVTGLTRFDIGAHFTLFGQIALLALVQLGGLSITTIGTFLLVLLGRRLSVQNEFTLIDTYGMERVNTLRTLLLWVMGFTFLFEGCGTLVLCLRYLARGLPVGEALYYAFFHAVSAFCNAGFSLHPESLVVFQQDPVYLLTISFLIIVGGLGFVVLYNLAHIKFWRRNLRTRGRLTLHSRIVLVTTLILILAGMFFFTWEEWDNTLLNLPVPHKLCAGFFQAVTPRTAGFHVVPMEAIRESTRFTTNLLMFIGGSPGSTAGGLKTTTLTVLIATVIALCRNRRETVIFSRSLSHDAVREAIAIFMLAILFLLGAFGVLLWTESPASLHDAANLFFETVSAFSTVGLATGRTASLSIPGQYVIITCMFLGRLGPLAVVLMVGSREERERIRFPQEDVVLG